MGRFEQEAPFILYFLVFTWRSTHGATEKLAMRDGSLCVLLPPPLSLYLVFVRARLHERIHTMVDRERLVAFLTPATRV